MGNSYLTPLGGNEVDILWANPSPESVFAAQSVDVPNAEKYKYLAISFGTESSSEVYNNGVFLFDLKSNKLNHAFGSTAYTICSRDVSVSGDSVTFSDGKLYTIYGTSSANIANNAMVPLFILGVTQ